MYYPEDLREDTTAHPSPTTLPLLPLEQSLTTQEPSQGTELPVVAQKEKKGGSGGLSNRREGEREGEGEGKE